MTHNFWQKGNHTPTVKTGDLTKPAQPKPAVAPQQQPAGGGAPTTIAKDTGVKATTTNAVADVAIGKIDVAAATKAQILALAPGAKFTGTWTTEQLNTLLDAVNTMPEALRSHLAGVNFNITSGAPIPKDAFAYTVTTNNSINFRPEVFKPGTTFLGKTVPAPIETMMHEFAHAVNSTPDHVQDFAKLSGWKETVIKTTSGLFQNKTEVLATEDANGVGLKGEWAEGNKVEYKADIKDIHDPSVDKMMGGALGKALYSIGDAITGLFGVHLETLKVELKYSHANVNNFVGDLAQSKDNPREDYAESFRMFVLHPDEMIKKAPEKFLAINQEAKTYSPDQLKAFAAKNGADLGKALTQAVIDGRMYQAQVDEITATQGVAVDKALLQAADKQALTKGGLSPLQQAFTVANSKIQAGDTAFTEAFKKSPETALGPDLWKKLSAPEQALINNQAYRDHMVADAQAGRSTGATAAEDAKKFQINNTAIQTVMTTFFDPGPAGQKFRKELETDPVQAMKNLGVWLSLPADIQNFLSDTEMQEGRFDRIKSAALHMDQALKNATPKQLANYKKFADSRDIKNYQAMVYQIAMPGDDSKARTMQAIDDIGNGLMDPKGGAKVGA